MRAPSDSASLSAVAANRSAGQSFVGGRFASLADVLRQIGLDERHHKEESLAHIAQPRFK